MADKIEVKAWVMPYPHNPKETIDPDDNTAPEPFFPEAFIQWKGTDVCLDFYCPCGKQSHFDGFFAYALKCGACGKVFTMPSTVELLPVEGN